MVIDNISINEQSSIRLSFSSTVYFDPFHISGDPHDAGFIFFTHDHYDHFSPEDIAKIQQKHTVYIAPVGMKEVILEKTSIQESSLILMDWGETKAIGGMLVETVPAYNIDKKYHPKEKHWQGYIITIDGNRIYIAGDTDATKEASGVSCDIAIIPIGGVYTMDHIEAAKLARKMDTEFVIPSHYGSIVGDISAGTEFKKLVGRKCRVVLKY